MYPSLARSELMPKYKGYVAASGRKLTKQVIPSAALRC